MPPRPFPLPLTIGTDICHVNRVRQIITKSDDHLRRYIRRFLTPREEADVLRHPSIGDLNDPKNLTNFTHFLAGRWAAKEATIKAVTWRKLSFHDIIIRRAPFGKPFPQAIILDDPAHGRKRAESKPVQPEKNDDVSSRQPSDQYSNVSNDPTEQMLDEFDSVTDGDSQRKVNQGAYRPLSDLGREDGAEDRRQPHLQDDDYEDVSGQVVQISISHDGQYATAVCLAAQQPMEGDVGGEMAARNG